VAPQQRLVAEPRRARLGTSLMVSWRTRGAVALDFQALLGRRGHLHYAVFDVLWLNGKDLRCLPLSRRKRSLERLIPDTTALLSPMFWDRRGRALFGAAEQLDLEGIVAKRKADPYGPATVWHKAKNRAYTQREGRWELFHRPPV
jgi:ATP-dependent DNA ligase